ncbi:MAG: hypothetical protein ACQEQM_00775 [Thermoplasmatota archaeon]
MGWIKASDVANSLDLHIATCTKYLDELHEIDLLEMREGKGKTGKIKEYRLKDPRIELHFEIENTDLNDEDIEFYKKLYESLTKRTEGVYGSISVDILDLDEIENISSIKVLIDSIRKLLEFNEKTIGLNPTRKLVKRSGSDVLDGYNQLQNIEPLLESLPPKYFDLLKEEYNE